MKQTGRKKVKKQDETKISASGEVNKYIHIHTTVNDEFEVFGASVFILQPINASLGATRLIK